MSGLPLDKYTFKTLNYLGSKFRLVDFVKKHIDDITSEQEGVCDLFAGSGCVSYNLSQSHPVIACDIQEYSHIICKALLNSQDIGENEIKKFFRRLRLKSTGKIMRAFKPLITIEENAIRDKKLEILADVIEFGSIEVFCKEKNKSRIQARLTEAYKNLRLQKLINSKTLISRYYGGVYFSYKQSVWIDEILEQIHSKIDSCKRDIYLAALLSTVSEITDTVGKHFAQPLKVRDSDGHVKMLVYNKAVKDKTIDVLELYENWLNKYAKLPKTPFTHRTMQGEALQCLQKMPKYIKTVYADPPYTREHYSRYYHVLETIVLRDSPNLSTVSIHGKTKISNGIYRQNRFQSPFCIRSKAPKAFEELFKRTSSAEKNLVLSYSPYDDTKKTHPRVVTIKQLMFFAETYYNSVKIVSAGQFTHSKLNSSDHFLEASDEAELLIICTSPKKVLEKCH